MSTSHEVQLKSSNIAAITHDARTNELVVRFKSGSRYAFENVPRPLYASFIAADSHGAYFADHIRGRFKDRKL